MSPRLRRSEVLANKRCGEICNRPKADEEGGANEDPSTS